MSHSSAVSMRFFQPAAELRTYFNAYFLSEVSLPDGETVSDFLMPSWGLMTFCNGGFRQVKLQSGVKVPSSQFSVTGPFEKAARLTAGSLRQWNLGILPAGWARFVKAPACEFSNLVVDGQADAFSAFSPLADTLFAGEPDPDAELARIENHLETCLAIPPDRDEARIGAILDALQDPETANTADLARRAGIGVRTLQRLCKRAFGFSPKTLLRRQRFHRSTMLHTIDPSLKWSEAMDGGYHDQAQFVREFRQFMGMSPNEYALLDRPFAVPLVQQRKNYDSAIERAGSNSGSDRTKG